LHGIVGARRCHVDRHNVCSARHSAGRGVPAHNGAGSVRPRAAHPADVRRP
jgi:hypothetical protein